MRLTKQSGYAVRIVIECALAGDKLTRIADIAKRYNITKHNIAKTVPILVRHGIIEGVRGRNGGIRLARPPSEITVGEIVRASETTHVVAECFGGEEIECAIRPAAPINRMLDSAMDAFISVLDHHTVDELINARVAPEAFATGAPGAAGDSQRGEASPEDTPSSPPSDRPNM